MGVRHNTKIAAGFVWRRNIITRLANGGTVEGGWVTVREATFGEWLRWALFRREPRP